MKCRNCGYEYTDSYQKCFNCGIDLQNSGGVPGFPKQLKSHLLKSIIATIFFVLPLGVVAIVYSVLARNKIAEGDLTKAEKYSNSASTWGNASIILGLSVLVIVIIISSL